MSRFIRMRSRTHGNTAASSPDEAAVAAAAAASEVVPVDKGFLSKAGVLRVWQDKSWKKRYGVLASNTLFLYKNDKAYLARPRRPPIGMIRLAHNTPVSEAHVGEPMVDFSGGTEFPVLKKSHALKIVEGAYEDTGAAAIYYFACLSALDCEEWCTALRHNIDLDRKPRSAGNSRRASSALNSSSVSFNDEVPTRISSTPFKVPAATKSREEREAFDCNVRRLLHSYSRDSTTHLYSRADLGTSSEDAEGGVTEVTQRFPWEIDWNEVEVVAKIGEGGFGEVLKGEWRNTEIAIKQLVNEEVAEADLQLFLREIALMSQLRHPNIVLFMGASIQFPNIFYMTEYLSKGNMKQVLEVETLSWTTKLRMALDTARGMNFLHLINPPVLHRDLKSLNLLVDENYGIRVADFGLCKLKDLTQNTKMGTINWVAPEILRESGPYTEKADVFSFGLVLWEILTEQIPYHGMAVLQIVRAIDVGKRPDMPPDTDADFALLVQQCWADDPVDRPMFDVIYKQLKAIYDRAIAEE